MQDARLLAPDVILAHATATLDAPSGPLEGVNRSTCTAVVVEVGGHWRITAFHNTLVSD